MLFHKIKVFIATMFLLFTMQNICAHQKEKFSKYHDVGFFMGGAFYSGDLNPYKFIDVDSPGPAAGFLYRFNFDRRNSLRIGANYGFIYADDATNEDPFFNKRNLNFQSHIYEVNTIYEFNFFPYEMGYKSAAITPYIFGGIGGFFFNPVGRFKNENYKLHDLITEARGIKSNDTRQYKRVQVCIPFGIGVKMNLGKKMGVQLDWGVRKTFTDYLDDVSTVYPSYKFLKNEVGVESANLSGGVDESKKVLGNVGRMRGNSQNKDYYSFIGLSFTFKISFASKCPTYND